MWMTMMGPWIACLVGKAYVVHSHPVCKLYSQAGGCSGSCGVGWAKTMCVYTTFEPLGTKNKLLLVLIMSLVSNAKSVLWALLRGYWSRKSMWETSDVWYGLLKSRKEKSRKERNNKRTVKSGMDPQRNRQEKKGRVNEQSRKERDSKRTVK